MKIILFLFPLLWLVSCAHNTATKEIYTIKHQSTGVVVRIHNDIPIEEAKRLINYLYDYTHDNPKINPKFKNLYNIHRWKRYPKYNDPYEYIVNFKEPISKSGYPECNENCIFVIDEMSIRRESGGYVEITQHYLTEPPGWGGHPPSELPPESYSQFPLDHPPHVKFSPLSKLKYEDCLPKEIQDKTCYYTPPPDYGRLKKKK